MKVGQRGERREKGMESIGKKRRSRKEKRKYGRERFIAKRSNRIVGEKRDEREREAWQNF